MLNDELYVSASEGARTEKNTTHNEIHDLPVLET
jgi:hypothetical protein